MSKQLFSSAFIALMVLCLFCPAAFSEHHPATSAEDVEVIRSGGINMYRYRDQNGDMVVVDRPPPQFFKTDVAEDVVEAVSDTPVEVIPVAAPALPPPEPSMSWVMRLMWLLVLALLVSALVVWVMPLLRRWRGETPVDRALRLAELPVFQDLKISGVGGRYVVAERVVRTPAGLVVLALAKLSGELRGPANADQWVRGTTPVANPLKPVQQAVEFLQAHVPEVPVVGRAVDLGNARFAGGKPEAILSLAQFTSSLTDLRVPGPATRTLDGAWRTLMKLPRSNQAAVRPVGVGPVGWIRRHQHQAGAAALGCAALVMAITLLIVQLL